MRFFSLFLLATISIFLHQMACAQDRIDLSLFPAYHAINSDSPSSDNDFSKTNLIFGGTASFRTNISNYPIEFSLGYTHGKSAIMEGYNSIDERSSNIYLTYRSVPGEILYVHQLDENTEVLAGINFAAQQRILTFEDRNPEKDRLLSFGMGLSAQIRKIFRTFSDERGIVFGSLFARWTEYLIHDSRDRNLDDYTLRHLTLSPQIEFSWKLLKQ